MTIAKVLAVYRVAPLLLVVEAEDGTVVELSLKELHKGGHRLSAVAWRDLVEDYQLFTCRVTPHEESRRAQSARQSHPPA
ncbi:MAG TPA: hypothetical protein VHN13_07265 [Candidatus Tectomicrobia bacterium]|jgi:hypothetical protein|nr:hypothetical protein [Candidatus Tectomicrobia bacterium]